MKKTQRKRQPLSLANVYSVENCLGMWATKKSNTIWRYKRSWRNCHPRVLFNTPVSVFTPLSYKGVKCIKESVLCSKRKAFQPESTRPEGVFVLYMYLARRMMASRAFRFSSFSPFSFPLNSFFSHNFMLFLMAR